MRKALILKNQKQVDVLKIGLPPEGRHIPDDFKEEYGDNAYFTTLGCHAGDSVNDWFGESFENAVAIALRPMLVLEPGSAETNDYLVYNDRIFKMLNDRFAISVGSIGEFVCENFDFPEDDEIIGKLVEWDFQAKAMNIKSVPDIYDNGFYIGLSSIETTFNKVAEGNGTFEHTSSSEGYWKQACEKALEYDCRVIAFKADTMENGYVCKVLSITENGDGKYLIAFEGVGKIPKFKSFTIRTTLLAIGALLIVVPFNDFGNDEEDSRNSPLPDFDDDEDFLIHDDDEEDEEEEED